MSSLSTHVLDAATGTPATGMRVALEQRSATNGWSPLGAGTTDADGRLRDLAPVPLGPGVYRLTFDTEAWTTDGGAFWPEVSLVFRITEERHYHVPLLLSPFAYSTYRGS